MRKCKPTINQLMNNELKKNNLPNNLLFSTYDILFHTFTQNELEPIELDVGYLQHSGEKTITSFVYSVYKNNYPNKTTIENIEYDDYLIMIANLLYMKYNKKWNKLFTTYKDYLKSDTLIDYKTTEAVNGTNNESINENLSNNTSITTSITVQNDIYGFNSTSSVPSNSGTNDTHSTNSSYTNKEQAKNINDKQYNEDRTKTGIVNSNINELLDSTLESLKSNILDIIYKDVDSMITLRVYQ